MGIRGGLPKGPPGPAPSPAGRCVATCVSVTRRVSPPSSLPNRCLGPDLDECQARNLCQHACRNTEGSYRCLCPAGYRLLPSGKNCQGERAAARVPQGPGQGSSPLSPASSPPSRVREGQGGVAGVKWTTLNCWMRDEERGHSASAHSHREAGGSRCWSQQWRSLTRELAHSPKHAPGRPAGHAASPAGQSVSIPLSLSWGQ